MGWVADTPALSQLDEATRTRLERLSPMTLEPGTILFRPGDSVRGYAIILSGRIDVRLTGVTGREILLYSVVPGQSCIQSTIGLMGGDDYSAEASTQSETHLVLLPGQLFQQLLNTSDSFRTVVFQAFAERMQNMMQLLEKVSFQRVECRLAERLLALHQPGQTITVTQAELAVQIGTAREVISRKLESWSRRGWVKTGRGHVTLLDMEAMTDISRADM